MKQPMSDKSDQVKEMIEHIFPGTAQAIADKRCPLCKQPITEFRSSKSIREYEISGMCQDCQDQIFGVS